jgi:predicted nucleic acid-binding protein
LAKLPQAFVVDASVSAAWLLPDEANAATESALLATATHDVWVPALWLLEVGNLLHSAQRRKRISSAKRRELVVAAAALRLKVDRDPLGLLVLDDLAATHGLSVYDAVYLELAVRRGLPLATRDAALLRALPGAGVERALPKS